ncbi:ribosomal protein S5 (chloroplast) [Nannochloropsis oceanica]|uniref:Small ribosomal subunit protein uS5c n=1 Tax=Nannochloropsis oceanica TaxID=145522 RepID=T1RJ01_9STRA|nr:ribosomal protein S5 [Nannochloropsis oceanica]AHX25288.1 30S ribosomal protein S5 [Nannochloropsis oceanica]
MKIMKNENQKSITHKVIEIRRVCKVGKGGKTLNFRALIVVGNQKGIVGLGIGKASQVLNAIKKGQSRAIQNRIQIAMTRTKTIPHKSEASFGAAQVMLRPAAPGSGVIAGGAIRTVLETAGIKNILAKQLRSKNKINNARATLVALSNLTFITVTAKNRGLSLEKLTGRKSYEEVKDIKLQSKSINEIKSSRKPRDGEGFINKNKGQ